MAITRQKKEEILDTLVGQLEDAKSAVFADFRSMKVAGATELRRKGRKDGVRIVVAKKTLMKLALEKAGYEGIDPSRLEGSVALMLGMEDEVAPARLAAEYAKAHEGELTILAGILERKLVDDKMMIALSKLPSRDVLLAKAVGSIAAPMSGMLNVLQGNLRNLVYALNAIREART